MGTTIFYQCMPEDIKSVIYQNLDLSYTIILNVDFNTEAIKKIAMEEVMRMENDRIKALNLPVALHTLVTH